MSEDSEKYKLAKENQDVFREAIKSCMDGSLSQLMAIVDKFLTANPSHNSEEFFTGFKSEGRTILHIAASGGHKHIFEYVIKNCGITKQNQSMIVDMKDYRGFTPLINATISESIPVMQMLVDVGADVNLRNNDGASAAHFAAGDGSIERLQLLQCAGAKLDESSHSGTPLHWAAGKARSDAISFLVEQGVDVNRPSPEGLSAVLMAAVASCDLGVSFLVEKGKADIGTVVSGNLTPLHISAEHGLLRAVQSILRTEVGQKCCTMQTSEGNTPLHLAAMAKHREVIRALIPFSDITSHISNTGTTTTDIAEELIDKILVDGAIRLQQWEAQHSDKHKQKAVVAESVSSAAHQSGKDLLNSFATPADSSAPSTTPDAITPEAEAAAETHKDLGNVHYKKGDYQKAVDEYTNALYLNKFNATYWSNRSACYLNMKKYPEALKDAEICRHLRPNWTRACFRLASARLALKQYEDAALAAFEGVKLDEKNEDLKELLRKCVKAGQVEHQLKIAEQKRNSGNS
mmetsp:Transcript_6598/g.11075  ORF Transcript_6598/g.11075 Transcript_6598/m.11075 type:complete len:518 (-) Transcript_6598:1186-2739(-)